MEAVVIALAGAVTGFFSWRASVHSKSTRDDLQTNHGKRPGEYLEMIQEVRKDLANHTLQDAENFDRLSEHITRIWNKGSLPLQELLREQQEDE